MKIVWHNYCCSVSAEHFWWPAARKIRAFPGRTPYLGGVYGGAPQGPPHDTISYWVEEFLRAVYHQKRYGNHEPLRRFWTRRWWLCPGSPHDRSTDIEPDRIENDGVPLGLERRYIWREKLRGQNAPLTRNARGAGAG